MRRALALAVTGGFGFGCGAEADPVSFARAGEALPDFAIVDENPTSPTSGASVAVVNRTALVELLDEPEIP